MDFPTIEYFEDTEPTPLARSRFHTINPTSDVQVGPKESPVDIITSRYPRIMKQMELLWGTQDMQDKFNRWLFTDQEGRHGWPVDVHEALMELSNFHAMTFNLEGNVVWGKTPDRW